MSNIIDRETIFLDTPLETKTAVLNNIANVAWKEKISESEADVLSALESRENELSTGVGMNIAIPHCKSDCIKEPKLFVYKLSNSINWGQEEDVNLIFAILTNDKNSEHLSILAKLSRGLLRKDFLSKLRNSSNEEEVYTLLTAMLD